VSLALIAAAAVGCGIFAVREARDLSVVAATFFAVLRSS